MKCNLRTVNSSIRTVSEVHGPYELCGPSKRYLPLFTTRAHGIIVKYSKHFLSGRRNNFRKYPRSTIDSLGTPYDYGSVMHYGSKSFSRNGRPTIVVKKSGVCYHGTLDFREGCSDVTTALSCS